jgi:hypothetical protein
LRSKCSTPVDGSKDTESVTENLRLVYESLKKLRDPQTSSVSELASAVGQGI